MSFYYFFLAFSEGILTFVSPCILPLLPVYFSYLAGVTGGASGGSGANKHKLIVNSAGFVIGFSLIFVLLGATATVLGSFLKNNLDILRKASGIVMILLGLNFAGIIKIPLFDIERRLEFKFEKLRFLSSMVFGITFAFGWTPCLGPFLASAVLMAGNSAELTQGVLLLLAFSAGLGIPFIITSILFDKLKNLIMALRKNNRIIGIVSGIVLILTGILIFIDKLKYLNI